MKRKKRKLGARVGLSRRRSTCGGGTNYVVISHRDDFSNSWSTFHCSGELYELDETFHELYVYAMGVGDQGQAAAAAQHYMASMERDLRISKYPVLQ